MGRGDVQRWPQGTRQDGSPGRNQAAHLDQGPPTPGVREVNTCRLGHQPVTPPQQPKQMSVEPRDESGTQPPGSPKGQLSWICRSCGRTSQQPTHAWGACSAGSLPGRCPPAPTTGSAEARTPPGRCPTSWSVDEAAPCKTAGHQREADSASKGHRVDMEPWAATGEGDTAHPELWVGFARIALGTLRALGKRSPTGGSRLSQPGAVSPCDRGVPGACDVGAASRGAPAPRLAPRGTGSWIPLPRACWADGWRG